MSSDQAACAAEQSACCKNPVDEPCVEVHSWRVRQHLVLRSVCLKYVCLRFCSSDKKGRPTADETCRVPMHQLSFLDLFCRQQSFSMVICRQLSFSVDSCLFSVAVSVAVFFCRARSCIRMGVRGLCLVSRASVIPPDKDKAGNWWSRI